MDHRFLIFFLLFEIGRVVDDFGSLSSLNLFFLSSTLHSPLKQVVLSIVYITALSRFGVVDLNGGNKKDKNRRNRCPSVFLFRLSSGGEVKG